MVEHPSFGDVPRPAGAVFTELRQGQRPALRAPARVEHQSDNVIDLPARKPRQNAKDLQRQLSDALGALLDIHTLGALGDDGPSYAALVDIATTALRKAGWLREAAA